MEILHKEKSYRIVGACFEVYNDKGCGFLEPVYQECLSIELANQQIPFFEQSELQLEYKGQRLKQTYKPDFVCFEKSSWNSRRSKFQPTSTALKSTTI